MVRRGWAWQWWREFRRGGRGDDERNTVMDTLMKEITQLRKDRDNRRMRIENYGSSFVNRATATAQTQIADGHRAYEEMTIRR